MTDDHSNSTADQTKKLEYPNLPPRSFASMKPDEYISDRLNQTLVFYDKGAVRSKNRYLRMRASTVIAGAFVPVLVNLDQIPYVDILTTLISIAVVLLVSLESVFHYREQWVNYRSTEQYLRKEYFLFTAEESPYGASSPEEAFRLFVERVESAIDSENTSTLQVMTTVSEPKRGIQSTVDADT